MPVRYEVRRPLSDAVQEDGMFRFEPGVIYEFVQIQRGRARNWLDRASRRPLAMIELKEDYEPLPTL